MTSCALCGRHAFRMSRHHLVPRSRLKRHKRVERKEINKDNILDLCRPCHSHIHTVFSETELNKKYFTLEAIREHLDIIKFVNWIKTKPEDFRPTVRR